MASRRVALIALVFLALALITAGTLVGLRLLDSPAPNPQPPPYPAGKPQPFIAPSGELSSPGLTLASSPIPRHSELGETFAVDVFKECQAALGKGWWRK